MHVYIHVTIKIWHDHVESNAFFILIVIQKKHANKQILNGESLAKRFMMVLNGTHFCVGHFAFWQVSRNEFISDGKILTYSIGHRRHKTLLFVLLYIFFFFISQINSIPKNNNNKRLPFVGWEYSVDWPKTSRRSKHESRFCIFSFVLMKIMKLSCNAIVRHQKNMLKRGKKNR